MDRALKLADRDRDGLHRPDDVRELELDEPDPVAPRTLDLVDRVLTGRFDGAGLDAQWCLRLQRCRRTRIPRRPVINGGRGGPRVMVAELGGSPRVATGVRL